MRMDWGKNTVLKIANTAKRVPKAAQDVKEATRGSKPGPEPHEKAKVVSHISSSQSACDDVISTLHKRLNAPELHENANARRRAYKAMELLIHCLGHCSYAFASVCSSHLLHSVVLPLKQSGPEGLQAIAARAADILESEDALLEHKDKCAKTAARVAQPMPGSNTSTATSGTAAAASSDANAAGSGTTGFGSNVQSDPLASPSSISKLCDKGEGAGEANDEVSDDSDDGNDHDMHTAAAPDPHHAGASAPFSQPSSQGNAESATAPTRALPKVNIKSASSNASSARHSPAPSLSGPLPADASSPSALSAPPGLFSDTSAQHTYNNSVDSTGNGFAQSAASGGGAGAMGGDANNNLIDLLSDDVPQEIAAAPPRQETQQQQQTHDPFVNL